MPRLLMLHKPKGYVVTRSDEKGRKTVYDLLPDWARREGWMPAGRLDLDSRGLLLFSREGKILDALTRPGHLDKTYEVLVRGLVTPEHVARALAAVGAGHLGARPPQAGFAPNIALGCQVRFESV